jgi:hypothetical protein
VFRADALGVSPNAIGSVFAFDRRLDDIPIEDDDGEVIIIPSGTTRDLLRYLPTKLQLLLFSDERIAAHVYIMPIDFGIRVSGLVDDEGEEKFTAPLPVFNRPGRPF